MKKIWFYLEQYIHQIWFRCVLYCIISLSLFFILPALREFVPDKLGDGPDALGELVSQDALAEILKILASSMLAVSIFSLSIVVQAFQSAATTATPRANELMMQNATAHNALGTFIGAFLFSIVGTIAIRSGVYDAKIVNLLFACTLIIIAIIVLVLLRWIDEVSRLGRVNVTIGLVEDALLDAIKSRAENPFMKCNQYPTFGEDKHLYAFPVYSSSLGYVQYIDIAQLNSIAEEHQFKIALEVSPGTFCDGTEPFLCTSEDVIDDIKDALVSCFIVGHERTYSQDPRYGFVVLSEIAMRALSPGINDPGTAVHILSTQLRALHYWITLAHPLQEKRKSSTQIGCGTVNEASFINTDQVGYSNIYAKSINGGDVLEDIFGQLIRDAAVNHITAVRLRKMLESILAYDDRDFAPHAKVWLDILDQQVLKTFEGEVYQRIMGQHKS
ncbi:MAG TPA: hypothetical protein DHW71_00200 [Gammaproteobacteria bacterium]|nr:hypothetical protein [Gammaproteobacteria bacterium]HCK91369.1 hypothetical protein [Gammaproteobacteria bacterium]|tara:strand:- start:14306 stop:15637 length:1332 start_codon:yes stop_codon:yes gene_type:complete